MKQDLLLLIVFWIFSVSLVISTEVIFFKIPVRRVLKTALAFSVSITGCLGIVVTTARLAEIAFFSS